MSILKTPDPVKPVVAIFSSDQDRIHQAARRFEEIVGPIDYVSEPLVFDQTEYYRAEMGWPLYKRIFSAENLKDPAELVDIKVRCLDLEAEFAEAGRRTVNLDPGYVSKERLVLATGKNATHRIYLGRGVWADLTLVYRSGGFRTLPWTYPNYATEAVRATMADIRKKYLHQLKNPGTKSSRKPGSEAE